MQLRVDASKNLQRVQHYKIELMCIAKKETACDNQNFTTSKHISPRHQSKNDTTE